MRLIFSDDKNNIIDGPSIFIAGPTSRDNVFEKSWRKDIIDILRNNKFQGTVCIPEFRTPREFTDKDWDAETDWEWDMLEKVDCILFWVPRKKDTLPGLTTNLEFGMCIERYPDKVVLAYPLDADEMQWLKKKYMVVKNISPIHSLEDAAHAAIILAKKNYELIGENLDTKYRKRMKSNRSSAARKSDHKHEYKKSLFRYKWISPIDGQEKTRIAIGEYCTICGRISNMKYTVTEKIDGSPMYRALSDNELIERHKNLDILNIDTPFEKYVNKELL